MKRYIFVLAIALVTLPGLKAQKKIINIPDIPGYVTLKCDFHIHTVFSDGQVWPTYRIDEAWKDGLDVLAITDHLEYQPKKDYIPTDHNAAWDIARNRALERNMILVHSTEITRSMPPGHLNALFVDDASIIFSDSVEATVSNAVAQGAFIQWNHPGWKSQEPDGIPKLYDIHKRLIANGMINGIEFFNSNEYYPLVLDWGKEFNIAMTANSDEHGIISESYEGSHRPMTLVFARERTTESLKEAMLDARTVAWFEEVLAGPEDLLQDLFRSSIEVGKSYYENDSYYWIEVRNNSDVPFHLINGGPGVAESLTLGANSLTNIRISKEQGVILEWDVKNLMTGSDDILHITL
jgi:predicted metal-dependent phosphoesterase TrpH